MAQETTKLQWGVKLPDGTIEGPYNEGECNEGYMTCSEYAEVRAKTVKGKVVMRRHTVHISHWMEKE